MSEDYLNTLKYLTEFSALCILGETVEGVSGQLKISQFNLDEDTFKQEFTQRLQN